MFRIAGLDLGLNITLADLDRYIARQLAHREPVPVLCSDQAFVLT